MTNINTIDEALKNPKPNKDTDQLNSVSYQEENVGAGSPDMPQETQTNEVDGVADQFIPISARGVFENLKKSLSLKLSDECFVKNEKLLEECATVRNLIKNEDSFQDWAFIFKRDAFMSEDEKKKRGSFFLEMIMKKEFEVDPDNDLL